MSSGEFKILPQPDDVTCGPTSLHAIYNYYGNALSLDEVISGVAQFQQGGGTLGVVLGVHALKMGFKVTLFSYNLKIFDPTWFQLDKENLLLKLQARLKRKRMSEKEKIALASYIEYVKLGGELKFKDLSSAFIRQILRKGNPILVGLSSTWLYQAQREDPITNEDDDVLGDPSGHFVVLYKYDEENRLVSVADPLRSNPLIGDLYYNVSVERLITSILLGVMTYDGNFVVIEKKKDGNEKGHTHSRRKV